MSRLISPTCLDCGQPFTEDRPRCKHSRNRCLPCFRRDQREYSREYIRRQASRDYSPATTRKKEIIALGPAPGPESWPTPRTIADAEKLARAQLYHADLKAGRPIRFVPQDKLLCAIRR